jgi:hypothetical protein
MLIGVVPEKGSSLIMFSVAASAALLPSAASPTPARIVRRVNGILASPESRVAFSAKNR